MKRFGQLAGDLSVMAWLLLCLSGLGLVWTASIEPAKDNLTTIPRISSSSLTSSGEVPPAPSAPDLFVRFVRQPGVHSMLLVHFMGLAGALFALAAAQQLRRVRSDTAMVRMRVGAGEWRQLEHGALAPGPRSWSVLRDTLGAELISPTWSELLEAYSAVDLQRRFSRLSTGIMARETHSSVATVLVVVGIVFTFQGVKGAAQNLTQALRAPVVTAAPSLQSRHVGTTATAGTPVPQSSAVESLLGGKSSADLQEDIADSLAPLANAFGANLAGIVWAVVLYIVGMAVRQERGKALAEANGVVVELLLPILEEVEDASAHEADEKETLRVLEALSAIAANVESSSYRIVGAIHHEREVIEALSTAVRNDLGASFVAAVGKNLEPLYDGIRKANVKAANEGYKAMAVGLRTDLAEVFKEAHEAATRIADLLGPVREAQNWIRDQEPVLGELARELVGAAESIRHASPALRDVRTVSTSLAKLATTIAQAQGALQAQVLGVPETIEAAVRRAVGEVGTVAQSISGQLSAPIDAAAATVNEAAAGLRAGATTLALARGDVETRAIELAATIAAAERIPQAIGRLGVETMPPAMADGGQSVGELSADVRSLVDAVRDLILALEAAGSPMFAPAGIRFQQGHSVTGEQGHSVIGEPVLGPESTVSQERDLHAMRADLTRLLDRRVALLVQGRGSGRPRAPWSK